MKRFLTFVIISLLLFSCAKKQLQKGNYDNALRISVKKLKKNPNNQKYLMITEDAFNTANRIDNDRIEFLKKEGSPSGWDEIFSRYSNMKRRQTLVKTLTFIPPGIQFTDYDNEIIQAKQKAAEYYYAKGEQLLAKGDRFSAREAYDNFMQVKKFYVDFKDVEALIAKSEALGTNYVLFKMQNASGWPLPPAFENELTNITVNDLSRKWLQYHTNQVEGAQYDYTVLVNLKQIDVSPEQVKESERTETAKIQDGFEYVLDSKGNVKKDSAGNDIKVPKYVNISCKILETQQRKVARVAGTIDYLNNMNNQVIKTIPVAADAVFEHFSAQANGDMRALSAETKKKLNSKPVPFPPSPDMLLQAAGILKGMTRDILVQHKGVLQ
jgi:tetratricopeptide (TPR) repeat protein